MAYYAQFGEEAVMKALHLIFRTMILTLLTASVLLTSVSCDYHGDDEQLVFGPEINEEYELARAPLIYKKQQLIREKEDLVPNMEIKLGNTSYMSFIFTELHSAIYTDVYPVMHDGETNLAGVIAFSADELPGLDGKISIEQYGELIANGWGSALYWNGEVSLGDFIVQMKSLLENIGIELPASLMFGPNLYTYDYDVILSAHGIENAVHGAEGELQTIESGEPDGVWHPGCIEWRRLGVSPQLKRNIEKSGGYALFEVRFSTDDNEKNVRASYFPIDGRDSDTNRPLVFANMIRQFRESIKEGKIEVLNIDDTRDKTELYYSNKRIYEAENAVRAAELDEQIKAVDREITDLYAKYH